MEADEDGIEEVLASHDQELADAELMQLQEQKIRMEIKCHSKQHQSEVGQELDVKRWREISL